MSDVLKKIDFKIKEMIDNQQFDLNQSLGFLKLIGSCYPEDMKLLTKDIDKVLEKRRLEHKETLSLINSLVVKHKSFTLNDKEYNFLTSEELLKVFTKNPYKFIQMAYCFIPENLILLSLGQNHES